MENLIQNFLKNMKSNNLTGLPSGFKKLDKSIHGFEKGSLYTLAGRPSMGKTTLALNITRNIAIDTKAPVAYFSYEMTEDQITSKLISIESEINSNKFYDQSLEEHELESMCHKITPLAKSPIYIESLDSCTIDTLAEKAEKLISEKQVEIIIIDDIQRVGIDIKTRKFAVNREQEISHNVRMLKSYSMKWNIPIIIISQLNRQTVNRGGEPIPILTDLRDSGSIENDSDAVIFLYRPEYYGITEDEMGNDLRGIASLIIAKNRRSTFDTIEIKYNSTFSKFSDLNKEDLKNRFDASAFDEKMTFGGSILPPMDDDAPF